MATAFHKSSLPARSRWGVPSCRWWWRCMVKEPGNEANLAEFKGKRSVLRRVPEVFLLCWKTHLPGLWSAGSGALKAGSPGAACLLLERSLSEEGEESITCDRGWHRTVLECGARGPRPPWQPGPQLHLAALRPRAQTYSCPVNLPWAEGPNPTSAEAPS